MRYTKERGEKRRRVHCVNCMIDRFCLLIRSLMKIRGKSLVRRKIFHVCEESGRGEGEGKGMGSHIFDIFNYGKLDAHVALCLYINRKKCIIIFFTDIRFE